MKRPKPKRSKSKAPSKKKRAKKSVRTAKKAVRTRKASVKARSAKKTAAAKRAVKTAPSKARSAKSPTKTHTNKTATNKTPLSARRRRPISTTRRAGVRPAQSAVRGSTAAKRPKSTAPTRGIVVRGTMGPRYDEILNPAALRFLADLHRKFDATRNKLLGLRARQQVNYDAGDLPDFLADTADIRARDWEIAPIPADLQDRRVEITGPVDRKMVINALNSGANVYMADFEDANSPTWENNLEGQINLKDRWSGALSFADPETGKDYALSQNPAVLIVRPRGWHLPEVHVTVDGAPISASLFDFGLYFFNNARAQIDQGTGPYFYLPKLETHLEARLWSDVFKFAEAALGLSAGTIKATVLIETLPAAFEMDEILWELRDNITGLNAGRWDYIFSFIKKLKNHPDKVLPDRGQLVMGKAFLGAYAALLVKTCHRRGAFAMGGMAAQIPVKGDEQANRAAFAKVKADKEREVAEGHDGTWVAHPALVQVAEDVFDQLSPLPNQLDRPPGDAVITRDDLLRIHDGTKTEEGFRHNIRVGVQYIEAWLCGRGAVPIYNLMEDAATAEISRAQIWQWIKYGAELEGGITVTRELFAEALMQEMARVKGEIGADAYANGRFPEAIELFRDISMADTFEDFLTLPAYKLIA